MIAAALPLHHLAILAIAIGAYLIGYGESIAWHERVKARRNARLADLQAQRESEARRIAQSRCRHARGARDAQARLVRLTAEQLKLECGAA